MNNVLCCFFLFSCAISWPNNKQLDFFFKEVKNKNFTNAQQIASEVDDPLWNKNLTILAELMTERTLSGEVIININEQDEVQLNFIKNLILGYQFTYASKQNNLESFKHFTSALKLADEINSDEIRKAALIGVLDLFASEIFIGSKQFEPYLEQFIELKEDIIDEILITKFKLIFLTKADDEIENIDAQYYFYYDRLDSIFASLPKTHNLFQEYYFEKGIYHKIEGNYEKAEDFFLKADSLAASKAGFKYKRSILAWQIALINLENNNINQAKRYLTISENLGKKLKDSFYNSRLKSLILKKEGKHDSAYYYLNKSVDIEYQLGYKNNTLESAILSVQNQTDKLKLDKLELDAQNRKNRNWASFLGLLLLLSSVIAFLIYSNTKRKQLLAEQGQMLQEEKVENLLKEQELTTIDAMIEGQEKERQRIANDLHDDLGGLMASVKLHFNSLHTNVIEDTDELYKKTNSLIDEAYHKIRAIAHAKNSGVIAKQGLLKAVTEMAEKVSIANSIVIDVKDYGLDNRLENSLELTLFRIVQELITNIIKHSHATKANIHLTNHGETLNILIEDNGKGFNTSKIISSSKGMGLKSIEKRITHLEGTIHVESEPGKGATVIIDIPI